MATAAAGDECCEAEGECDSCFAHFVFGSAKATTSGCPPDLGIPAPTTSKPPTTAGHAFTPARIVACHRSFPSLVEKPYTTPAAVAVKTTSFATVAQPS